MFFGRRPIPVAARYKVWVCGHSFAGIAGSNPAWGRGVRLLWLLCYQIEVSSSGRSPVQRSPTECDVSECGGEASTLRRPWPTRTVEPQKKKKLAEGQIAYNVYYRRIYKICFIFNFYLGGGFLAHQHPNFGAPLTAPQLQKFLVGWHISGMCCTVIASSVESQSSSHVLNHFDKIMPSRGHYVSRWVRMRSGDRGGRRTHWSR